VGVYSILGFKASFSFPIGNFRYFRSLFSPSQDPNFPNIVAPVLLNAQISENPNFETIFGPSKWIGATVDKVSILENRAFQYTVTAVCPPQFIQMSGNDVLVRYDLTSTIGSYVVDPNELFQPFRYNIPASNGFYYKLTQVTSTAVTEYKEQEDLRNQIAALEKKFSQAYQAGTSYSRSGISESYEKRIESLKKQLNA
jgi:hypothetical protein